VDEAGCLALFGEQSGSAAFVVEYAPTHRRGWYGGWQFATVGLGLGAGLAAGAVLSSTLSASALQSWGWRLPFLVALPLGLVGLYIRLRLEETPEFLFVQRHGRVSTTPVSETLRTSARQVIIGFGVVATVSLTFNLFFVFLPNFVASTGRVPLSRALFGALLGLLLGAILAPVFGLLTDRVGRRRVVIAGVLALVLLTVPAFSLVTRGSTGQVLLGYAAIGVALGTLGLSTFVAELFPTHLRYSGLSLTYGLGSTVFGGSTPLLGAFLVQRTGNTLLPAWYAAAVSAGALVCALLARETAPRVLAGSLHGEDF
jgi:MHS family proline/betaine transporter-like MFS transporter